MSRVTLRKHLVRYDRKHDSTICICTTTRQHPPPMCLREFEISGYVKGFGSFSFEWETRVSESRLMMMINQIRLYRPAFPTDRVTRLDSVPHGAVCSPLSLDPQS